MDQRNAVFNAVIIIGAVLGWFAVIFQLWLLIINRVKPVPETLVQFFSYFTILTNIIVALYFTLMLSPVKRRTWIGSDSTATAVVVYILVVGIVYNLVLRQLWAPTGLQKMVDELLHTVNPLYFLLYWVLLVPKVRLNWKDVLSWLIYPFVYCIYILVRGQLTNEYPYPFIDAGQLGLGQVLLNCVGLFVFFLVLSLLFVGIAKALAARR
jgi:hypothetical protein